MTDIEQASPGQGPRFREPALLLSHLARRATLHQEHRTGQHRQLSSWYRSVLITDPRLPSLLNPSVLQQTYHPSSSYSKKHSRLSRSALHGLPRGEAQRGRRTSFAHGTEKTARRKMDKTGPTSSAHSMFLGSHPPQEERCPTSSLHFTGCKSRPSSTGVRPSRFLAGVRTAVRAER
ncbi:hypothetical protein CF319_g2069 [Tilletia indica]|uniref:Uncharacterized protein n=1 Tax=Tilletia indica TaxID=43049 RepID=A0A177TR24_9BASI|nr:hypothetical protein CF319_g2069 [Tilletia indica]KAE8250366.1 hypothetical protein A4X13_0g4778 [Tilletia indica]